MLIVGLLSLDVDVVRFVVDCFCCKAGRVDVDAHKIHERMLRITTADRTTCP